MMIDMLARIRSAWRPVVHWPLAVVAVYAAALLFAGGSDLQVLIGALTTAVLRGLAAYLILRLAAERVEQRSRRSWRYLGVGVALWTAAVGAGLVARLALGGAPAFPTPADLLTVAGSLAILSGIAGLRRPEPFGRLRELLEVTILVASVASLTWLIFVRTALRAELADPIRVLWSGVAPALDLVAAGLLVRHALRSEKMHETVAFSIFAFAALVSALADLGDGYRRLQSLQLDGGAIELGWMMAALLLIQMARRIAERRRRHSKSPPRLAGRLEPLLPIALTYAVVGSAVVDWWTSEHPDWFVIGASGMLSLLLMARQGVIAGQIEMRQYAALVNASADLSFICDADGVIVLANPAFALAVGGSPAALVGTDLKSYFNQPGFQRTLEQAAVQGWSGEAQLLDGAVPLYLSLRPVQDERRNRPLLAGTGVDLRAIKRRESELESALEEVASARLDLEQLNSDLEFKVEERTAKLGETVADLARVNEELKELDRMKTEFVALVSHELRSPLANIRSGLELVLKRSPELGHNVEESLGLVHRETRRLSTLVETIMDLSALEAGRFPLDPQPLELDAMAREVIEQFPSLSQLHLNLADDLPPITADVNGLKSVLYHLLDNASKYAPDGDLTLEAEAEDGMVQISLTDSGPGIPDEDRERIFEMFHRLDSRDSREIYGHGLGLPMAKRLVEAMGGEIRALPAEGRGARFVIRLPRAEPK